MMKKQLNKNTDAIFTAWECWRDGCGDSFQGKYFAQKLKDGHDVVCQSINDVFTKEEIRLIKRCVRPQKGMCYKNAFNLVTLFPDRVKYVEGEVAILDGALGIEHAWNLVDGKHYVDITFEMVLHDDVTIMPYVALGIYDKDVLYKIADETQVYGGVYDTLYRKEHQKN